MSTTLTIGTVKRVVAILIAVAIVVAAGIVVGQAPAIFDEEVAGEPEASIEFEDQQGNGSSVTIGNVTVSDGGFVVVTDSTGEILGVSDALSDGSHGNVTVEQRVDSGGEMYGRLTATVHQHTSDNESFAYEATDGEEDRPYLEDGYPVSDTASVTMAERPAEENASDSFVVESIDTAGETNETLEFTGEIRNPSDDEISQHVELRIDGRLLERQVLSLEPDETREVTFEVDRESVDSGTHIYGVYTAEDGEQAEIEID